LGFLQVKCEPQGSIAIYLYATELGVVTLPMSDDSYALVRGSRSGDGYGLVPDAQGVLRVEAEWITEGTRVLAVGYKGVVGLLPGPKQVGATMVDGNAEWPEMKFNKTGYKGPLSQVISIYTPRQRGAITPPLTLTRLKAG